MRPVSKSWGERTVLRLGYVDPILGPFIYDR